MSLFAYSIARLQIRKTSDFEQLRSAKRPGSSPLPNLTDACRGAPGLTFHLELDLTLSSQSVPNDSSSVSPTRLILTPLCNSSVLLQVLQLLEMTATTLSTLQWQVSSTAALIIAEQDMIPLTNPPVLDVRTCPSRLHKAGQATNDSQENCSSDCISLH